MPVDQVPVGGVDFFDPEHNYSANTSERSENMWTNKITHPLSMGGSPGELSEELVT